MGAKRKSQEAAMKGTYIANKDITLWNETNITDPATSVLTTTFAVVEIGKTKNIPQNTHFKVIRSNVDTVSFIKYWQVSFMDPIRKHNVSYWVAEGDLTRATKQATSSADGYSYDAGSSATSWHYPVIALGVGLGIGFLAGRHFAKK